MGITIPCPPDPAIQQHGAGLLRQTLNIVLVATLAAFAAGRVGAQAPAAAPAQAQDPRFDIQRFIVDGATLVPKSRIDEVLAPFAGKGKTFADAQRGLEALEKVYSALGYSAVQVILPEQELEKGEVRFKVVEAKIGKVVIEGNKNFDEGNIRRSVPRLVPGSSPNINDIAEVLRVANESPAKQTTVLLRGSQEEGEVDAVVRVSDEKPLKFSFTTDNTGTSQTGIFRTGIGFQHANMWNRDHVLSMQYVTSPHDPDYSNKLRAWPNKKVFIFGMSYKIPLYSLGDSLEMSAGYSNVNSGVVQNLFNVAGSGSIFGLRYNYNLRRIGDLDHRLQFGFDYRAYGNRITAPGGGGAQLVPDVTVHPYNVAWLGTLRGATNEISANLAYTQNAPGGNDGASKDFEASRAGARPGYTVWRAGANYNQAFSNDIQLRMALNGQFTRDKLISGEQFGVGGADSVRGFLEREITNDHGYRGTGEVYSPDFGSSINWTTGIRARAVLFYDFAMVQRNEPLASEVHRQTISSWGFGIRISQGTNFSMRMDFARVIDAGGAQTKGDGRLHASMAYVF